MEHNSGYLVVQFDKLLVTTCYELVSAHQLITKIRTIFRLSGLLQSGF